MKLLNELPVASLTFVAVVVAGFYCLVTGSIDFQEFGVALGIGGVGSAAVGKVRNDAGRGFGK